MNTGEFKKRLIKNLTSNTLVQLINVVTQVIAIPLYIRYMGLEAYGAWIVLMTIPGYLAFIEFGFTPVASNHICLEKNTLKKNRYVSNYLFITMFIAILAVMETIFIYYNFNNFFLSNINNEMNINIILVLSFFYFSAVCGLVINIKSIEYRLAHKQHRQANITVIIKILEVLVFMMYSIIFKKNVSLNDLAFIYFIFRLMNMIFIIIDVNRVRDFKLKFELNQVSISEVKNMIFPAATFSLLTYINILLTQTITVIVNIIGGPIYVVVINSYRTIMRSMLQFSSIINSSVMPELTINYSMNNNSRLRRIYLTSIAVVVWFGGVFSLIMIGGYQLINKFFFIPEISNGFYIYLILIVESYFFSIWLSICILFVAINMHARMAITSSLLLSISIFLCFYFKLSVFNLFFVVSVCYILMVIMTLNSAKKVTKVRFRNILFFILNFPNAFIRKIF